MINKNLITKIHKKQDNAFETYRIGAEAEDVFVRNGDRERYSAQSLLLKDAPWKKYNYGSSIWSSTKQNFMPLTWNGIIDMVNDNIIDQYLKPGDCIIFNQPDSTGGPSKSIYLYVIGINTHNGQPSGKIGLPHIDFCGGSLIQLLGYHNNNNTYSEGTYGLDTGTPFNVLSNNGEPYGSETSAHFIMNSSFCKDALNYESTNGDGKVLNDSTCCSYLRKYLRIPDSVPIARKNLYLSSRISNFPILKKIKQLNGSENNFNQEMDNTITELINLYDSIETNSAKAMDKYLFLYRFLKKHLGMKSSDMAMAIQRHGVGIDIDTFFQETEKKYSRSFASDAAIRWLRYSVGLMNTPPNEDIAAFETWLKKYTGEEPLSSNEVLTDYSEFMSILDDIYFLSMHAYKNGSRYKSLSDQNRIVLQSRIYCLTEQELFGTCTLGNPFFEQGQAFQYPIFKDMLARKNILTNIGGEDNYIGSGLKSKRVLMPTLTPVNGSSSDVAGMDTNTFCVQPVNIAKNMQDYLIDTPICFRIEKTTV